MEDEQIIQLYFDRDEQALIQTHEKYGSYCFSLARTIRSFLNQLPEREQNIFLRRYFFVEESDTIAGRYGMKPATVLRTLSRTRKKLKNYLTQEGYRI